MIHGQTATLTSSDTSLIVLTSILFLTSALRTCRAFRSGGSHAKPREVYAPQPAQGESSSPNPHTRAHKHLLACRQSEVPKAWLSHEHVSDKRNKPASETGAETYTTPFTTSDHHHLIPSLPLTNQVADLFAHVDVDGSGTIDKVELRDALSSVHLTLSDTELDRSVVMVLI